MDISAIIYAALGGGSGAALGSLLLSLFQKMRGKDAAYKDGRSTGIRSGLVATLAVAGGMLCSTLYKNMTFPRILPMDDSAIIAETPVFGIIKKQNSEAYKQIIKPSDRADRNGEVKQSDLDEMRAVYFKLIRDKTEMASGDTLRLLDANAEFQYEVFAEKAPRVCTLMLNGEPFPALETYFSPEEIKAEQKDMVKLFTADPRDPDFIPDLERGKVVFEASILTPMKEMGISDLRPDVSETADNDAAHIEICELGIAYLKNKQALSDEDNMNLTAYLQSL